LYNPFSKAAVQLPVLDTIIDKSRKVRKVLVRSTTEDALIVAIMTNSLKCPFILIRGGNTAWLPESWELVYGYIIDIAFLEGKLYAITQDEDLFPIDIGLDDEGKLMVANGGRTIRQPPSYNGYHGWSEYEDVDIDVEEGAALLDDEASSTIDEEDHGDDEEGGVGASYEDNDDKKKGEAITLENKPMTDDDDDDDEKEDKATTLENEPMTYDDDDYYYDDDYDDDDDEWKDEEEACEENVDNLPDGFDSAYEVGHHGNMVLVITVRYLIESRGKLLMVRQYVQLLGPTTQFTCRVEVFEASTDAWVPMTNGLGGGHALFLSTRFSKSVPAPCGEIEEDTIYFANTGEVFNMRSQTCSPTRWAIPIPFATWVFPPDLVV
jgi:hypothetical protein